MELILEKKMLKENPKINRLQETCKDHLKIFLTTTRVSFYFENIYFGVLDPNLVKIKFFENIHGKHVEQLRKNFHGWFLLTSFKITPNLSNCAENVPF